MRKLIVLFVCSISMCMLSTKSSVAKTSAKSMKTNQTKASKKASKKSTPKEKEVSSEKKEPVVPPKVEKSTKPNIIQFVITDLHRGITRDQRLLRSPRVVTLQVLSPRRPLNESLWKGQSLEVFRLVPLNVPNISLSELFENNESGSINVPELPPIRVSVGFLEIKSVHGMTIQAVVQTDDLSSRDLFTDMGEAKVVMIGDLAERPQPKARVIKKAPRRVRKAPKSTPFERKEMRWKM